MHRDLDIDSLENVDLESHVITRHHTSSHVITRHHTQVEGEQGGAQGDLHPVCRGAMGVAKQSQLDIGWQMEASIGMGCPWAVHGLSMGCPTDQWHRRTDRQVFCPLWWAPTLVPLTWCPTMPLRTEVAEQLMNS